MSGKGVVYRDSPRFLGPKIIISKTATHIYRIVSIRKKVKSIVLKYKPIKLINQCNKYANGILPSDLLYAAVIIIARAIVEIMKIGKESED